MHKFFYIALLSLLPQMVWAADGLTGPMSLLLAYLFNMGGIYLLLIFLLTRLKGKSAICLYISLISLFIIYKIYQYLKYNIIFDEGYFILVLIFHMISIVIYFIVKKLNKNIKNKLDKKELVSLLIKFAILGFSLVFYIFPYRPVFEDFENLIGFPYVTIYLWYIIFFTSSFFLGLRYLKRIRQKG